MSPGLVQQNVPPRKSASKTAERRPTDYANRTLKRVEVAQMENNNDSASDTESDFSVTKLKGWLDDFGKQNKNHFEKVNKVGHVPTGIALQKPVRQKIQVRSTKRATEQLVERGKGKPTMTPVRFQPKFRNVQATDNGYASVKQLSAWLADDPTNANKTKGCVRRGINVIKKSRMFEKDLEHVIIEEAEIDSGSVDLKKNFLETAFQPETADAVLETKPNTSVSDKKKWLSNAFVKDEESLVDGYDGDNSTNISVNHKREWLASAFKKGSQRMLAEAENDDDTEGIVSAKKRFLAKSKRRTGETSSSAMDIKNGLPHYQHNKASPLVASPRLRQARYSQKQPPRERKPIPHLPDAPRDVVQTDAKETIGFDAARTNLRDSAGSNATHPGSNVVPFNEKMLKRHKRTHKANQKASPDDATAAAPADADTTITSTSNGRVDKTEQNTNEPSAFIRTIAQKPPRDDSLTLSDRSEDEEQSDIENVSVADSDCSAGFSAAREILLARSRENGNPVTLMSKVQMRKARFEKWEKNLKKGAGAKGLLKPSWQQAGSGRPSVGSYDRRFVSDIAPKKSFDELP